MILYQRFFKNCCFTVLAPRQRRYLEQEVTFHLVICIGEDFQRETFFVPDSILECTQRRFRAGLSC